MDERSRALLRLLSDGLGHHLNELKTMAGLGESDAGSALALCPEDYAGLISFDAATGVYQARRPFVFFDRDALEQACEDGFAFDARDSCVSTNDLAREPSPFPRKAPDKVVRVAHFQTKGRGRQGKKWIGMPGSAIMFSMRVSGAGDSPTQNAMATLVAAASIASALRGMGAPAEVKWPNDLMLGEGKLAGILVERVADPAGAYFIVGVGLNYSRPDTPLRGAAYLLDAAPRAGSAQDVLLALCSRLARDMRLYLKYGFSTPHIAYMAAFRHRGTRIKLMRGGKVFLRGECLGVDGEGSLLVVDEEGALRRVGGCDVTLREDEGGGESEAKPEGERLGRLAAGWPPSAPAAKPERERLGLEEKGRKEDAREEDAREEVARAAARADAPLPCAASEALLLDCGNSKAKWAWERGGEILGIFRSGYNKLSELGRFLDALGEGCAVYGSQVCGEEKRRLVEKATRGRVVWLEPERRFGGVENGYRKVERLGSDRWFNLLGASLLGSRDKLVVSCGTAIVCDSLTADGYFRGGSILPGFHLMRDSLAQNTARLDTPDGAFYDFPTTTSNAVFTGVLDAGAGAVLRMLGRCLARQKPDGPQGVDVIMTGGGAARLAEAVRGDLPAQASCSARDDLIFLGMMKRIGHL